MDRFTISLDATLATQFDELIAARGYSNRSEAVRDLIRGAIEGDRQMGVKSLPGYSWNSPRGPVTIDPATRASLEIERTLKGARDGALLANIV